MRHIVALGVLLLLSVAINVTGYQRQVELTKRLDDLAARQTASANGLIRNPGDPAPKWSVRSLTGASVSIDPAAAKTATVVYVFTPTCAWCLKNLANIRTVADAARGRWRMVGVSLREQALEEYLQANPMPFEVTVSPDWETQVAYGLGATPMTFVIGSDGVVQKTWRGAFTGEVAIEVAEYFNVQLPGIATAGGM